MPTLLTKQPAERFPVALEFASRLPPGTSLSSAVASGYDLTALLADDTILVTTTPSITGTQALIVVQGGTTGHLYKVTIAVTLNTGTPPYVLEEDFHLGVRAI
jgi:hypothetical protein